MCGSLSYTHCWYEVGMLKVPHDSLSYTHRWYEVGMLKVPPIAGHQ